MTHPSVSCALVVTLVMAQPVAPASGTGRPAGQVAVGRAVTPARTGSVVGTAWMSDNSPVSNGLLRLRNLTTGRIVMGTQADATGRFGFDDVPGGSYLVELVNEDGSLRAVGQMFSVGPGETVATFVRLRTEDRWFDGFFTNAAAAALAAAASLGVTAVGDGVQPASPRF